MSVKVINNTGQIKSGILVKSSIFLRAFAEQVVNEAKNKTPRETGRLRNDVLKQVLGLKGKIVWNKNYAIYQEKKQYRNYTTAGTGPHFAENAIKKTVDNTNSIARAVGLI